MVLSKSARLQLLSLVVLAGINLLLAACSDAATATPVSTVTTIASTAQNTNPTAAPVPATPTAVPVPTNPPTPAPPTPTITPAPPTATPQPTPTPRPPANDGRWVTYIAPDGTLYAGRADGSAKNKVAEKVQNVEWSPDGRRFIFYKPGENFMFMADFDGSNPHQLTTINGYGKWLPSGKNLLFPPATTTSHRYNIVSDTDGKLLRTFDLSEGFVNQVFDLAPDGKSVIYSQAKLNADSSTAALRAAEYHLLDLDTRQDKVLATTFSDAFTVWNADFTEIIAPDTKDNTIKAISLKTGQSRPLSKYNQLVALRRDNGGNRVFWVNPLTTIRSDGSGLKSFSDSKVTYQAGSGVPSYYLNIANDGSSVIYASADTKDNGGGVFRLDVTAGKISRIADNDITNPAAALFAGASQDNKLVAFTVRTSNTGIYTVKEVATGRQIGQLDGLPYWQPVAPPS